MRQERLSRVKRRYTKHHETVPYVFDSEVVLHNFLLINYSSILLKMYEKVVIIQNI